MTFSDDFRDLLLQIASAELSFQRLFNIAFLVSVDRDVAVLEMMFYPDVVKVS